MRQIAPRLLALVLAVSLTIPNSAYALRAPQRERRVQLAGLEDSLHGNPAWPGTPLVLPNNLLSAIPVLEPIGQGNSFLVLPLGDSPYVLKYRFTPWSPFDDLGYLFEKRDRYYHIENTIRAPLQLQELGLPQRVFVLRKIVERYPELQQFQAMGLLEVMEEPLKVRARMKRRGLDDPDMPFEERVVSLNTVILQPRVISLEDHLRGLLAAGGIDEAKASIDRYLDFTQELWKRAAYVADLDLSAVAVVDDQLKVFDAGNLLPLRLDARLPDMDKLDQGRESRNPPRDVPAGLLWIQEQVKGQLTARGGDSPALRQGYEAMRDYYAQQARDRVSSEQFMALWGTVRTPLEQRMLAAIEEALRKDKSGLEEVEKTAQTITNLLDASKAHEREEWVHGLKEWMQDNSKPFLRLVAARVLIEQMMVDLADQNYFAGATVRSALEKKRREAMEVRLEALKVLKKHEQELPPAKQDLKDYIDLQVHTFLSDGSKSPAAKVWEAYRKGVKAVGINDHNTFDHFEEAIRAGEILGITVYPSIELDFVAPELGLDKANGHALVYFPVGSLQEWEKTRARFPKELLDQVELRLKWNLMKIHKIVERFNAIHKGEGFEITSDDLHYRMGGHPNYAMVVNLLFVLERYGEKAVRDHFTPGETLDARELGKRLVKSDKRVDVDFQAALFDDEVKEGRMETEGTTRLFGVRAEVLGQLANLGGVLVLPHPKEGRFWVQYPKDKKPSWIPADYPPEYVVPVAKTLDKETVWIAPLLLQNYPFDGIELSGKKGEATAPEIRRLLDYLQKDPSQFLVTVGSDTHDNEFEEAGGYQLGRGMSLGSDQWSLSKTSVEEALTNAGLNRYEYIPGRMRAIFEQRQAVEKIVRDLRREDSGVVRNALNQVLEWVSKRDPLPPVLRQEIANRYQTLVDLVRKTAAEYRASETEGYSPRELSNSNWPWDPEGDSERAQRTTTEVRELAQRVLDALTQVSFAGLEEKTSKAVGPLRFLVDTGRGEAGVLRLLEMAVQLRLKDGVPVQAAGVATEEELAEAEAAMPDEASRELLRARVFTYTPGDEESHQTALDMAKILVPGLINLHPELIITEMNRFTVTWFLQALQRLGVNRFTQEMFNRIEAYLTAA